MHKAPLVGITTDLIMRNDRPTAMAGMTYVDSVAAAGATPVLLPPCEASQNLARRCDAIVLTGGDDPRTEPFGMPTHPQATPVLAARQEFEARLIAELRDQRPEVPVLGICLGMQMMALVAGGALDQHLPDRWPDADRHWDHEHPIEPCPGMWASGIVFSRHRQAVIETGDMAVLARSDDGLIEAIGDPARSFYLGVQWHPERTNSRELGQSLFDSLVDSI